MKVLLPFFLIMCIFIASCADNPADEGVNRLILGTGLGRGTITGVTQSFALPPGAEGVLIQWKLETKDDIGGGYIVSILIEQKVGDSYKEKRIFDYQPTDDYPVFYYIDSFYHKFGIGSFRATAYVGNRRIASQTYTVQ